MCATTRRSHVTYHQVIVAMLGKEQRYIQHNVVCAGANVPRTILIVGIFAWVAWRSDHTVYIGIESVRSTARYQIKQFASLFIFKSAMEKRNIKLLQLDKQSYFKIVGHP